ncbi:polypeptide N-acetylgalactosaminyltransferase [Elysia marginata]|uniref:Polypeptide N-acetylgalactosaminyltransferase n=1 Tax=Elysia marginata TaxID=1093978 RepID=A0AAV4K399_9GAST|nr:polypeptide N-acetylgalactosaminyltransferase [Elysia marginata]
MGRGVVPGQTERSKVEEVMEMFKVNTLVSDVIALNRVVPDSRIHGCADLGYPAALPNVSIIMPFYNEWPSILLRTVYSIVNRSPRHLLHQIILVDDGSSLESLRQPLDEYIDRNFPKGLITLLRLSQRRGLIAARMHGVAVATGDVLVFFDSHMEVNVDWLQPLLLEISKDRNTVAMATLDYIEPDSFLYQFNDNYLTRYGWSWNMIFFETFFRADHIGQKLTDPRPGPAMVGAAFAIDRLYFHHLGGYDQSMTVWGGENLEMSWRVWLCGGRLMHVPCSRIGHIARVQPYSFPGGREAITNFNYERAIRVWMGNYSRFVHSIKPDMKTLDVGDLSEREAIKSKLKCNEFSWYLHNVWPELHIYDENVHLWGMVKNKEVEFCLDNDNYLFQKETPAHMKRCENRFDTQGFSLTRSGELRTTLQCVTPMPSEDGEDMMVMLRDCFVEKPATWTYSQETGKDHEEDKRKMWRDDILQMKGITWGRDVRQRDRWRGDTEGYILQGVDRAS